MANPEWEKITDSTVRLEVFHGWIVCVLGESSVFVPDKDHYWTVEKEKPKDSKYPSNDCGH